MNIVSKPSPGFQGSCRNLQTVLDRTLVKKVITDEDKILLAKSIKCAFGDVLTQDKFIEEGSHNAVYKITRKYAARVPIDVKSYAENKLSDGPQNIKIGQGVFKKLKNYFGEALVEFGKFQILKNVGAHFPAGVPEHIVKNLSRNKLDKYYIYSYLPRFAKIPQSSYDELAKDLAALNEIILGPRQYCVFDSLNPNNIVARCGRLFLVDEIERLADRSYGNTTAKLFEVFINRASKDFESPFAGNNVKFVRKIFKKVTLASTRANLLHADTKEDFKNWEKALDRCMIKNDAGYVLNTLEQFERLDKETRIAKTSAFIDKLFVDNKL